MYPSLGLGISTAFQDAVELAKCLLSNGGAVDAGYESVTKRLVRYERNRIPACWALQTGSRFMHEVLAATSERPASPRGAAALAWISRRFSSRRGKVRCGCWVTEKRNER